MEDEIEDIVGDVKLTDSQKSVAISNTYSPDFTDSSSDRNNSSGKDTYIIEQDDSDTEPFQLRSSKSVINLSVNKDEITTNNDNMKISTAAATDICGSSFVSEEVFTQTSKTIFELAQMECYNKTNFGRNLETQTSFISITNKTLEYKIEVSNTTQFVNKRDERKIKYSNNELQSLAAEQILSTYLNDGSSKYLISETENKTDDDVSFSSGDKNSNISKEETKINVLNEEENDSDYTATYSDIEEDSLMECRKRKVEIESDSGTSEIPKSVDNDAEEMYNKLSETIDLHNIERHNHQAKHEFNSLTPLTEESVIKKENLVDITPVENLFSSVDDDKDVLFIKNAGTKVKILPRRKTIVDNSSFKLPPITNRSCPSSPYLNLLFTNNPDRPIIKSGTLPCVFEDRNDEYIKRWHESKELASGESTFIGRRNEIPQDTNKSLHLPPIHIEGHVMVDVETDKKNENIPSESNSGPISVKRKIRELKINRKTTFGWMPGKYNNSVSNSRNASPSSGSPSRRSPEESLFCDVATRGCEVLCAEIIRRLRSVSWVDIVETLEELPKVLDKFWGVITEQRIADLIRHVSSHVESPRTQVARTACNTLASILKTTNYTKKPDFYEAVAILLMKTGSFSLPVRRAANVALDSIVCSVELSHAVTAICVHGVDHKSPLVRCAASRLLVVGCALAGGGRELLRGRPQSAVCARKHALQALAAFLCDKNTETRKYAERLYSMLRPLPNFEAYYLTDVNVEIATRQMKKYDNTLLCGPPKASV